MKKALEDRKKVLSVSVSPEIFFWVKNSFVDAGFRSASHFIEKMICDGRVKEMNKIMMRVK